MALAVVFGGGGAHGAFQAGVWATLAPYLHPRFVIGSSIGAINAVATTRLSPRALDTWWQTVAPSSLPPYRTAALAAILEQLLATPRRESWPALAVCTPLGAASSHVVTIQNDVAWLLASSALPGWYAPRRVEKRWYVDGGVRNDLPVALARDIGATQVLAIAGNGLGPTPALGNADVIRPLSPLSGMLDFSLASRRRMLASGRVAALAWLRQKYGAGG